MLGYDEDGNRTSVAYPNDVTEYSIFDGSGRLTNRWAVFDDGATTNYLTYYTYTYGDSNGHDTMLRQTSQDITGDTTTWFYDELDRLVGGVLVDDATSSVLKTYEYSYDANGNRLTASEDSTTTTATYNAANEICWKVSGPSTADCANPPTGAVTYTFDANGSQTGNSAGLALAYNALNQTVSITPPGGTAVPVEYAGTDQTERTSYTDSQGGVTRDFTFTDTILGLTTRQQASPAGTDSYVRDPNGGLLARSDGTSADYHVTDALGSIVAVTDPSGAAAQTYSYDPWGNTTTSGVTGFDDNPWRYAAGYQDNNTGLIKYGTRYYDPTIGRWTQPDPLPGNITHPNTINRYTYAGNNPVNNTDPSGYFSLGDVVDTLTSIGEGAVLGVSAGTTIGLLGGLAVCVVTSIGCVIAGVAGGAVTSLAGGTLGGIVGAIAGGVASVT
jgi:RHS repeat-associated protein